MIDVNNNLEVASNYTVKLQGIITKSEKFPSGKLHKYVLTVNQAVYNVNTDLAIKDVLASVEEDILNKILEKINEGNSRKEEKKAPKDARSEEEFTDY